MRKLIFSENTVLTDTFLFHSVCGIEMGEVEGEDDDEAMATSSTESSVQYTRDEDMPKLQNIAASIEHRVRLHIKGELDC